MSARLVVVAWGSTDWAALHGRLDSGALPNLRRLIERGTSAPLASARPLMREPLYASAATGLLADRHGVLGPLQIRPDGGGVEPVTGRSWQAPPFWSALAQEGLRTACVNWPATRHASLFPGVHIDPDFATPSGADFDSWALPPDSVAPPGLADEFAGLRVHPADDLGPELLALAPRLAEAGVSADARVPALRAMLARVATVHAAAAHVAAAHEWDVLCVFYEFLHDMKAAFGNAPAGDPFEDVLSNAYALQDMMLGRLVALAGDEATIVVLSANGISLDSVGLLRGQPIGFLVAAGRGVAADVILPGVDAIDVAPTLLARYGLSAPSDGRVVGALAPNATLRAVPPPIGADTEEWDPAADLLSEGYRDIVGADQRAAMEAVHLLYQRHRALAALARRDTASAIALLEAVLSRRPEDMEALLLLARCRAMTGDYQACRPIAETLLDMDPDSPWGHLLMGGWCALAGDPARAEPYLSRARELGPDMPILLARLGGIEMLRDFPAQAMRDFEAALGLYPELADAAYGLGLASDRLGNAQRAEHALRHAIGLEQFQPLAHMSLGALLMRQGRFREAVARLETAEAQDPHVEGLSGLLDQARAALGHTVAAAAVRGSG